MKKILFLMLIGFNSFIYAQDFPVLSGDYLGQTPPGDTPVVFARGIISDTSQQHGAPQFTPDGNQVFWQTNHRPKDENGEWLTFPMAMRRVGGVWTQPEKALHDQAVLSTNGKRLYYPGNDGQGPFYKEQQGDGWSEPRDINLVARFPELQLATFISITNNSTLYFVARLDGLWANIGIYRSEFVNGEYGKPEPLPQSINLPPYREWTPFIAPDESYLIFCSTRGLPESDQGDLFICFRLVDGSWTEPVSMGAPINTNQLERFPTVSPDGKYLFFTRDTQGYDEDVYWVSAGIIDKLKAKGFAETVTDIDGNVYKTVTIGSQVWMAEDLKTTRYRNGDLIGTTTPATLDISNESAPKYQWAYAGDENNVTTFGRLYTWYAVTDPRNIAPTGWHVPTDAEWITLTEFLGGDNAAQGKLKEAGVIHWTSPNTDATNESGFTALPGGNRWDTGLFIGLGSFTHWWTTTEYEYDTGFAWRRILVNENPADNYRGSAKKKIGWLVRCVKDAPAK